MGLDLQFPDDEGARAADLPAAEIRAAAHAVRALATEADAEPRARERHPVFARDYPRLFAAALNPTFPLDLLDFMLLQTAGLSRDGSGIVEADTAVFTRLRERYGQPGSG